MLIKVYCSLFSAVAADTFNRQMIDFLQNKDESLERTVLKGVSKKEREMWKVQCGIPQLKV